MKGESELYVPGFDASLLARRKFEFPAPDRHLLARVSLDG